MAHTWAIYRDEIVFNDEFLLEVLDEIACRGGDGAQPTPIPFGTTLVLAARTIQLERDFGSPRDSGKEDAALAGFNWVLLADALDLGGRTVNLSAERGGPGTAGLAGPDEREPGAPGGAGGPGGTGGAGRSPGRLDVFCAELSGGAGSRIVLRGGAGGRGGPGGRGGRGGPLSVDTGSGGNGGRGGEGGPGGPGGAGGRFTLLFVSDNTAGGAAAIIDVSGGDGGDPGAGGPGGEGRDGGTPGKTGPAGTRHGTPGKTFPPSLRQLTSVEELWAQLRNSAWADAATEWSTHRTRVGEFLFRRWRPGEDTSDTLAARAAGEFESATLLNPEDRRSQVLREALLGRSTPIGFSREYDLIPDFPRYESVVADYLPVVEGLFLSAQILLQNAADLQRVRDQLDAQKARLQGSIAVLTIEKARADLGLAAAQLQVRRVDERWSASQQRLVERRRELEEVEWSELMGSFFEVGLLLAGFATGGVALPFSVAAPYAAYGITLMKARGESAAPSEIDFRNEKVSDAVESQAGGLEQLKELVEPGTRIFVSAKKVFDDIDAKVSVDPESTALLRELAMLAFEHQAAALRESQAALEVEAAKLELAAARADLARIATLRDRLATDTMALGELTRSVLKRTQGYVDIIIKYIFFAARALQLFSLSNTLADISFDYGYVDPDLENDAFRSLSRPRDQRGGSAKALRLLEAYLASWQRLPDILVLRDRFESYAASGQVTHDVLVSSVSDPASLKLFRETNELSFVLDLGGLPPSRYEDKVESVFVALVGATTKNPGVTCILEHAGQWTSRRRDGTQTTQRLSPRRTAVLGATSRREAHWLTFQRERTDAGFFGRGVATTWRLALERHEADTNSIDLATMSEILVGIAYRSFLQ